MAASDRNSLRLFRSMVPILTAHAVQVPDDSAIAYRHLADQLLIAFESQPRGIDESEIAVYQAENRNVGGCANGKMTKFLMMNLTRGMPGGHGDRVVERDTHVEKLRNQVQHILHACVH